MTNNRKLRSLLIDCQDIIDAIISFQLLVKVLLIVENKDTREALVKEYVCQIEILETQYKQLDFNQLD